MSKQKTDNAILDDTKVRFADVQKQNEEDTSYVAKNKNKDGTIKY